MFKVFDQLYWVNKKSFKLQIETFSDKIISKDRIRKRKTLLIR